MAQLSVYERKAIIAPKVDIDNAYDFAWHLVTSNGSRNARGPKPETLRRMRDYKTSMQSSQKITEPEAIAYADRIIAGFGEIAKGEEKEKVLQKAELFLQSLPLTIPEGLHLHRANRQPVLFDELKLVRQIVDLYYPLKALRESDGKPVRFEGEYSNVAPTRVLSEIEWWKNVALHNFPENNSRPRLVLNDDYADWLTHKPEEYKHVLINLAQYLGNWEAVRESPKLLSECGKEPVESAVRDLKEHAAKNGRIASLYPKYLGWTRHEDNTTG